MITRGRVQCLTGAIYWIAMTYIPIHMPTNSTILLPSHPHLTFLLQISLIQPNDKCTCSQRHVIENTREHQDGCLPGIRGGEDERRCRNEEIQLPGTYKSRERERERERETNTYTTFRPLVSRALVNKSKKLPPEQTPHLMSGACYFSGLSQAVAAPQGRAYILFILAIGRISAHLTDLRGARNKNQQSESKGHASRPTFTSPRSTAGNFRTCFHCAVF